MHTYTVVHVVKGGPFGRYRIEKVRASSPRAALARFEGHRLTVAEIKALGAKDRSRR